MLFLVNCLIIRSIKHNYNNYVFNASFNSTYLNIFCKTRIFFVRFREDRSANTIIIIRKYLCNQNVSPRNGDRYGNKPYIVWLVSCFVRFIMLKINPLNPEINGDMHSQVASTYCENELGYFEILILLLQNK